MSFFSSGREVEKEKGKGERERMEEKEKKEVTKDTRFQKEFIVELAKKGGKRVEKIRRKRENRGLIKENGKRLTNEVTGDNRIKNRGNRRREEDKG